jgi:hypothetical protein
VACRLMIAVAAVAIGLLFVVALSSLIAEIH